MQKTEFSTYRNKWIGEVVRHSHLTPSEKIVGVYLANRMSSQNQQAWPTQTTMARDLSLKERTIRKAVAALTREEFIYVERVKFNSKNAQNLYRLKL